MRTIVAGVAGVVAIAAIGCAGSVAFRGNYACVEGEGTGTVQTAIVRAGSYTQARLEVAAVAERTCGIGSGKAIFGALTVSDETPAAVAVAR